MRAIFINDGLSRLSKLMAEITQNGEIVITAIRKNGSLDVAITLNGIVIKILEPILRTVV